MGQDQPTTRNRSASTGSLPALGRRLSTGSLKAVKWIGKQFKNKKSSSNADSDELWGTSCEIPSGQGREATPPSGDDIEYMTRSTFEHRARRDALEKNQQDLYSFDSNTINFPIKPNQAQDISRPLTSVARGRRRLESSHSYSTPKHSLTHPNASTGYLPPRTPHSALRMRCLEREHVISALPRPGPPPTRPLPPPPVSLYPIPPSQPLNLSRHSSSRSQSATSHSHSSDPLYLLPISGRNSPWNSIYDD